VGMRLKTDHSEGSQDKTALNAIELLCGPPDQSMGVGIHSLEGDFGAWGNMFFCPEFSQVMGFELRSEADQGAGGDNTAANNLRLYCNSPRTQIINGDGESFGTWTGPQKCPPSTAVVGFRTQVEPKQNSTFTLIIHTSVEGLNSATFVNGCLYYCLLFCSLQVEITQPSTMSIWSAWISRSNFLVYSNLVKN